MAYDPLRFPLVPAFRLGIGVAFLVTLIACSTPPASAPSELVPRDPLGATVSELKPLPGMARIVVFRAADAAAAQRPANVYIANRFVAAVMPGGYTEHLICPGRWAFATVIGDAATAHTARAAAVQNLVLEAGQDLVLQVQGEDATTTQLDVVNASALRAAAPRRQQHALSRAPTCLTPPAAPLSITPRGA